MNLNLAFVVEDDADLSFIYSQALINVGYKVEMFYAGEPALERLESEIPKTILLDLNLPGISGVEVLQHIRASETLKEICVIIATANSILAETLHDEVEMIMIKPVTFTQMKDLMIRVCPPGP